MAQHLDTLSCQEEKLSWFLEYNFMKEKYLEFSFEFGWNLFTYLIYFAQTFCSQFLKYMLRKNFRNAMYYSDHSLTYMSNDKIHVLGVLVSSQFGWSDRRPYHSGLSK